MMTALDRLYEEYDRETLLHIQMMKDGTGTPRDRQRQAETAVRAWHRFRKAFVEHLYQGEPDCSAPDPRLARAVILLIVSIFALSLLATVL